MITYRDPSPSKYNRPRLRLLTSSGVRQRNSPREQDTGKNQQSPRMPIIRSQPLTKWYTPHAVRQCVCDFSKFTQRIPSPDTFEWCALPPTVQKTWSLSGQRRGRVSTDDDILSSSYLTHFKRLTSTQICVSAKLGFTKHNMKQGLVIHNETFPLRHLHESYKPTRSFSDPADLEHSRQ